MGPRLLLLFCSHIKISNTKDCLARAIHPFLHFLGVYILHWYHRTGKKQRVQKSNPRHAFKAVSLCLGAIMHSIASAAEGSCALIKLTSKYPCRHLQNTQNPLKSGWDGEFVMHVHSGAGKFPVQTSAQISSATYRTLRRRAAESRRSLFKFFDTRKPPVIEAVLRGIASWWSTAAWAVWCSKHLWG